MGSRVYCLVSGSDFPSEQLRPTQRVTFLVQVLKSLLSDSHIDEYICNLMYLEHKNNWTNSLCQYRSMNACSLTDPCCSMHNAILLAPRAWLNVMASKTLIYVLLIPPISKFIPYKYWYTTVHTHKNRDICYKGFTNNMYITREKRTNICAYICLQMESCILVCVQLFLNRFSHPLVMHKSDHIY